MPSHTPRTRLAHASSSAVRPPRSDRKHRLLRHPEPLFRPGSGNRSPGLPTHLQAGADRRSPTEQCLRSDLGWNTALASDTIESRSFRRAFPGQIRDCGPVQQFDPAELSAKVAGRSKAAYLELCSHIAGVCITRRRLPGNPRARRIKKKIHPTDFTPGTLGTKVVCRHDEFMEST